MDMRHLETDNKPETEAGYTDEGVTDNVDHDAPPLCLLFQFIDQRNHRIVIRAFLGKDNEPFRVIHNQQLVPEDDPDGERKDPDTNIDQQICEHISHNASYSQLRGLADKYIDWFPAKSPSMTGSQH
jgi:hypothetical protein